MWVTAGTKTDKTAHGELDVKTKTKNQTHRQALICLKTAMALSICLCASVAFAQDDIWTDQKVSFRRHGEPPKLELTKLFGLPVAQTLASLKPPLEAFRITSSFGWRGKQEAKRRKFHYGVDLGAPRGTPVRAAQDGVVEVMGKKRGFGYYVKVLHDNGVETGYGHLTAFAPGISRGATLQSGDLIGYVGSTGRATGPHLHYEVTIDGIPVDPEQRFQESAEVTDEQNTELASK